MFKRGIFYKKAGITLIDLVNEQTIQKDLFFSGFSYPPSRMKAIDKINRTYGRNTLQIIAQFATVPEKIILASTCQPLPRR